MTHDWAAMARQHLRLHRPATYVELMRDPASGEEYLARLGEQIAAQLALTERQLLDSPAVPADLPPQQRLSQARAIAEELVLGELLWAPDETTGTEVGPSGAYEGWEPGRQPLFEDLPSLLAR